MSFWTILSKAVLSISVLLTYVIATAETSYRTREPGWLRWSSAMAVAFAVILHIWAVV